MSASRGQLLKQASREASQFPPAAPRILRIDLYFRINIVSINSRATNKCHCWQKGEMKIIGQLKATISGPDLLFF